MVTFKILNNIGLYNDYEHQVDFKDLQTQNSFWNARVQQSFDECKINFLNDNLIRINGNYNAIRNASYCCADILINGNLKRYYYFITNIRVGATYNPEELEQLIELTLEEDVFQTYMFDYEIKESFVEREHQDRLLPDKKRIFSMTHENVDISTNNIIDGYSYCKKSNSTLDSIFYVVLQYVESPFKPQASGTFSSLTTAIIPIYRSALNNSPIKMRVANDDTTTFVAFNYEYIMKYALDDQNVYSVQIVSDIGLSQFWDGVYLRIPEDKALLTTVKFDGNEEWCGIIVPRNTIPSNFNFSNDITAPKNIFMVDELPKLGEPTNPKYESKLFSDQFYTAQLSYSLISKNFDIRNLKSLDVYHDTTYNGNIVEFLCPDSKSFDPNTSNFSEGFSVTNQNEIPQESNDYKNYMLNNKSSMRAAAINAGVDIGKSLIYAFIPGVGAGLAANTITSVYKQALSNQGNLADLARKPSQATAVGSVFVYNWQRNLIRPQWTFYKCQNYNEIFSFLTRLGYSYNNYKTPNLKSRYYYNFIKMIANLKGNLNVNILNQLKQIYNNGVTIWHYRNEDTFLFNDYSKENVEMNLLEANNG